MKESKWKMAIEDEANMMEWVQFRKWKHVDKRRERTRSRWKEWWWMGWGGEEVKGERIYTNRQKEQEKDGMEGDWADIGRGEKKEKNRVGKQQIEMEGGEQWIQLTDREKSCGFGAWEGECKQSIDYSQCWAECLGLRLLANLDRKSVV